MADNKEKKEKFLLTDLFFVIPIIIVYIQFIFYWWQYLKECGL